MRSPRLVTAWALAASALPTTGVAASGRGHVRVVTDAGEVRSIGTNPGVCWQPPCSAGVVLHADGRAALAEWAEDRSLRETHAFTVDRAAFARLAQAVSMLVYDDRPCGRGLTDGGSISVFWTDAVGRRIVLTSSDACSKSENAAVDRLWRDMMDLPAVRAALADARRR